jgi:hypothetical protein
VGADQSAEVASPMSAQGWKSRKSLISMIISHNSWFLVVFGGTDDVLQKVRHRLFFNPEGIESIQPRVGPIRRGTALGRWSPFPYPEGVES